MEMNQHGEGNRHMNLLNLVTEEYDRKARLYPALLLVAPLVVASAAIVISVLPALESLVPILIGSGFAFLLSQLARDAGKSKEQDLFKAWGGMPSVTIFRHRDGRLDPSTKARYHTILSRPVVGAKAPTVEQEQADPEAADAIYTRWSTYLRVNTRDSRRFPLVFQENCNYGYRRNVFGLGPFGLAVSLIGCAACVICLYIARNSAGSFDSIVVLAAVFDGILLLLWLFYFKPSWVRVPANAYSERLAEAAETLLGKSSSTKGSGKQ